MRNITFTTDGFYHVYNRGVEGRTIFSNDSDRYRFLQILYELNDAIPASHLERRSFRECIRRAHEGEARDPLVSIIAYCLMPNHFHLLVQPRKETGLQDFMHRVGTSYVKYFNQRVERRGRLFMSTFQAKAIETNHYLQHTSRYIHLNALSHLDASWKERGIRKREGAKIFLDSYQWSSYRMYKDRNINDILVDALLARDVIGDFQKPAYESFTLSWVPGDTLEDIEMS